MADLFGVAAAVVLNLGAVAFWAYITYVRIPHAQDVLIEKQAELAVAESQELIKFGL